MQRPILTQNLHHDLLPDGGADAVVRGARVGAGVAAADRGKLEPPPSLLDPRKAKRSFPVKRDPFNCQSQKCHPNIARLSDTLDRDGSSAEFTPFLRWATKD